jgi:hypothetical protein
MFQDKESYVNKLDDYAQSNLSLMSTGYEKLNRYKLINENSHKASVRIQKLNEFQQS